MPMMYVMKIFLEFYSSVDINMKHQSGRSSPIQPQTTTSQAHMKNKMDQIKFNLSISTFSSLFKSFKKIILAISSIR